LYSDLDNMQNTKQDHSVMCLCSR